MSDPSEWISGLEPSRARVPEVTAQSINNQAGLASPRRPEEK